MTQKSLGPEQAGSCIQAVSFKGFIWNSPNIDAILICSLAVSWKLSRESSLP